MSSTILLRGGTVLTLGVKTPNLAEGDVLIDGDRIAEVIGFLDQLPAAA